MGGEALSTGLRLPSTTPPASHWLSPEPHESRAFPAKQPLRSEGLAALNSLCSLQAGGGGAATPAAHPPFAPGYARVPRYRDNRSRVTAGAKST